MWSISHYLSDSLVCFFLLGECSCSGGDLLNSIINEGKYTQERASRYLRQMGASLKYLHSKGITHRDLKVWQPVIVAFSDDSMSSTHF